LKKNLALSSFAFYIFTEMGGYCSTESEMKTVRNSERPPIGDSNDRIALPPSLQDAGLLAQRICTIARAAGAAELKVYKMKTEDLGVKMKGDDFGYVSPVTEADKEATKIICSLLKELDENIPIVIEENEMEDYEKRKSYEYYWCCDPLDGTKEFLKQNGQFTVNIGLICKDTPVFGVVYVPTQDTIYYGGTLGNYGSWKQISKEGKPELIQAASFSRTDENLALVASSSHSNQATKDFMKNFNNPTMKSMGSSLKLLLVAEGTAHCYPRLAPTREWDTAAAHAIVDAAGGCVVIADVIYEIYENGKPRGLIKNPDGGKPVRYNKENSLNPYFVVWGKVKD